MSDIAPPTNIRDIFVVLNDMLKKEIISECAIGGAFAATLHDQPIPTMDLDIFFLFKEKQDSAILSLESIYDYAREEGFKITNEFIIIHGWFVQFVEGSHDPLWTEAIRTAIPMAIKDFEIPVISREHLVAMWLSVGRPKDYQKIAIFCDGGLNHEVLLDVLKRYNLFGKWNKEKWRFLNE